ncbi:MAG: IS91 family transposase [Methylococcaceae bacterium]
MILLSSVIDQFEADFLSTYQGQILPDRRKAMNALKICRTQFSPVMQISCADCDNQRFVPHSCGHRNCPHCQHHESQVWIENQLKKQLPCDYFMLTFTLPAQLRPLAKYHQKLVYRLMFDSIWETLQSFSRNDRKLKGHPGMIAILHTHARNLDYHPHIHTVMPAMVIDKLKKLVRTKGGGYLFNHKALAKVFQGKLLSKLAKEKLITPKAIPQKWIVNCKKVGSGGRALVYLGRYLYRGVIREKDILSVRDGKVTFRYQDSETKCWKTRTETGAKFLWLILQHVLPTGFRRARNFGFLHPNSKKMIKILLTLGKLDPKKMLAKIGHRQRPQMACTCCGGKMQVGRTRIPIAEIIRLKQDSQTLVPT